MCVFRAGICQQRSKCSSTQDYNNCLIYQLAEAARTGHDVISFQISEHPGKEYDKNIALLQNK